VTRFGPSADLEAADAFGALAAAFLLAGARDRQEDAKGHP
jgi:hypothetical protein